MVVSMVEVVEIVSLDLKKEGNYEWTKRLACWAMEIRVREMKIYFLCFYHSFPVMRLKTRCITSNIQKSNSFELGH